MRFPLFIRWGGRSLETVYARIDTPDGLRRFVQSAELDAQLADVVSEVDIWPTHARSGRPLMVQFLVGHPTASRMIIHKDGAAYAVRTRDPEKAPDILPYERSSGRGTAEAEDMAIAPSEILDLLLSITRDEALPHHATLTEQPMD